MPNKHFVFWLDATKWARPKKMPKQKILMPIFRAWITVRRLFELWVLTANTSTIPIDACIMYKFDSIFVKIYSFDSTQNRRNIKITLHFAIDGKSSSCNCATNVILHNCDFIVIDLHILLSTTFIVAYSVSFISEHTGKPNGFRVLRSRRPAHYLNTICHISSVLNFESQLKCWSGDDSMHLVVRKNNLHR